MASKKPLKWLSTMAEPRFAADGSATQVVGVFRVSRRESVFMAGKKQSTEAGNPGDSPAERQAYQAISN